MDTLRSGRWCGGICRGRIGLGLGILDGVLTFATQVEMQQRGERGAGASTAMHSRDGVKLDLVLRAHWGLDAFGERREQDC